MTNTENERRTEEALKLSSLFEELDGRRPRLFMPELEDDDDKEARKLAATTFADHGWDVDVSPSSPRKAPRRMLPTMTSISSSTHPKAPR